MESIRLFCGFVQFVWLAAYIDLAAFFHFVINPHLPAACFGRQCEFAYCLLVACLQALDAYLRTFR